MNTKFKLITIIIIALYCLTPLAAIELNQTNETKAIDCNNSAKVNNVKNYPEIKEVTTDSKNNQPTHFPKLNLNVHVDDFVKGQKGTIKISADKDFSGIVECEIFNSDYSYSQEVSVSHGSAEIPIDQDLNNRLFIVKVVFNGNDEYNASSEISSFYVKNSTEDNGKDLDMNTGDICDDVMINTDSNNNYIDTPSWDFKDFILNQNVLVFGLDHNYNNDLIKYNNQNNDDIYNPDIHNPLKSNLSNSPILNLKNKVEKNFDNFNLLEFLSPFFEFCFGEC